MASGNTLLEWHPYSNEPPSSNGATRAERNNRPCLAFDDSTNQYAIFSGVMPQHYDGNGVEVYLHIALASATSGDMDWDVAFERVAEYLDLDSDSWRTPNSTDNTTVPATAGLIKIVSVAFTDGLDMDNVAVGEGFRLRINRDAVSDTANGNAELYWVELREA
jgi:hypothetical protein